MALVPPTIREISALTGSVPRQWSRNQAALALDAAALCASLSPWWPLRSGYLWKEAYGLCPPLGGNARLLCDPLRRGQTILVGKQYHLHRAPIPASLWAALAVVRSGGDLHYYRARPVPVGGLFAIPLDTARSIGMDPWAVYDSLHYVRLLIEGTVIAWHTTAVPGPAAASIEDLVGAAVFQYLAGSSAATQVFGDLATTGVSARSIVRHVLGRDVDWSSAAFAGVGKDWVIRAAVATWDILEATKLVEGFWWAYQIGWSAENPTGPFDAVPRQLEEDYAWPFPDAALSDPSAAARTAITYPSQAGPRPPSMAQYLERVHVLYPMEYGDTATLEDRGLDPYQAKHVLVAGHYLVRHAVLAATVPGYLLTTAPPEPRTPQGPPRAAAESGVHWAVWLALGISAAAAAGGSLYWYLQGRNYRWVQPRSKPSRSSSARFAPRRRSSSRRFAATSAS